MLVQADMSEVTDSAPIEAGTYSARMVEVEPKVSKAGNDYLNWKGEIFDHEKANGRIFYHRTMLKGKGAFALADLYAATTGETLQKGSMEMDTDQLIGQDFRVVLVDNVDDEGNVRPFPDVKAVTRL